MTQGTTYSGFMRQVQHRLELAELGEAVRATRATLTTLGERLHEGEATDLASPLPGEGSRSLREADPGQRFDYDEFLDRVADRGAVDRSTANDHAQVIVAHLDEIVPEGNIRKVENGLPDECDGLFELVGEEYPTAGDTA